MTTNFIKEEYNSDLDYFRLTLELEKHLDRENFDIEIFQQINSRLGRNTITKCSGNQEEQLIIKNMNYGQNQQNEFWYDWFQNLMRKRWNRRNSGLQQMFAESDKKMESSTDPLDPKYWFFLTLNWDDKVITIDEMLKMSHRASSISADQQIESVEYVLEKHRHSGIHHHTHMLFTMKSKVSPSKIIGWIYNLAGFSKICGKEEFIDYLGPQKKKKGHAAFRVYWNYIRGNKCEKKLQYVELDRKWRDSNNIQDLYLKK